MDRIVDLEARLIALEDALVGATAEHFTCLESEHDDPLAAIEIGVNIVVENLRMEIESARELNRRLDEIIRSAQLLGAKCILTGVRPAVAQTLVGIADDFEALLIRRNLQDGLETCLQAMRPAKAVSREAREAVQQGIKGLCFDKMAVFGLSNFNRIAGKIVVTLSGSKDSSRFFTTEAEAIAWLRESR